MTQSWNECHFTVFQWVRHPLNPQKYLSNGVVNTNIPTPKIGNQYLRILAIILRKQESKFLISWNRIFTKKINSQVQGGAALMWVGDTLKHGMAWNGRFDRCFMVAVLFWKPAQSTSQGHESCQRLTLWSNKITHTHRCSTLRFGKQVWRLQWKQAEASWVYSICCHSHFG